MNKVPRYWFAAKRYGWGWGLPLTWEGWAVYGGWFGAFFGGLATLGPRHLPVPHLVFVLAMLGLLLAICYWKGEPPRWRSGDR
ncbi:MAG: hypothetical protein WA825_15200 [Steroidobacteraceae bacterium]